MSPDHAVETYPRYLYEPLHPDEPDPLQLGRVWLWLVERRSDLARLQSLRGLLEEELDRAMEIRKLSTIPTWASLSKKQQEVVQVFLAERQEAVLEAWQIVRKAWGKTMLSSHDKQVLSSMVKANLLTLDGRRRGYALATLPRDMPPEPSTTGTST